MSIHNTNRVMSQAVNEQAEPPAAAQTVEAEQPVASLIQPQTAAEISPPPQVQAPQTIAQVSPPPQVQAPQTIAQVSPPPQMQTPQTIAQVNPPPQMQAPQTIAQVSPPPQVQAPQTIAQISPPPQMQAPQTIAAAEPQQISRSSDTYASELVYHNPIAPSYIDQDDVIEPVPEPDYITEADAQPYEGQPEMYPPSDSMSGYGGGMQQGMGSRSPRSNQSSPAGSSHSPLGGLLGSLLGGNKNNGSFSADTIMDTVAGLRSNFGETISSTISSVTSPVTSIMDAFGIDSDKLIIIALILILLNEKSDKTLLLALGYLLIF